MKVKRYIANDMSEAMIKIKNELGSDAVILNTRRIKPPGLLGSFKKKLVEVTAAIDENEQTTDKMILSNHIVETPQSSIDKEEIEHLKKMMDDLLSKVDRLENHDIEIKDTIKKVEEKEFIATRVSDDDNQSNFEKILKDYLISTEIHPDIVKAILAKVASKVEIVEANKDKVIDLCRFIIDEMIGEIYQIDVNNQHLNDDKPNVFMFIGPTGVGKTTTVAKIAANLALSKGKKVCLMTSDTYRIAAVEQLRIYAEILGLPIEVIYEDEDIFTALEKYSDMDYILVDTAGRSHKSKELEKDLIPLINIFSERCHLDMFLVLSMTTSKQTMESIIESYHFIPDYKLIFSKLDETNVYGNILNMKIASGKTLSYFTIGQSVPDDIEVVDRSKLVDMLL